jgi:hypothetical protein
MGKPTKPAAGYLFAVFSLRGEREWVIWSDGDGRRYSTFLRKEQPSVRRALPPVGWHKTVLQLPQSTTV